MLTLATMGRRACGFILLVLMAFQAPAVGTASGADDSTLENFASPTGGFEVSIPADWHHAETQADDQYTGILSRETVTKEGDVFTFGVRISRLKNYKKVYTFKSQRLPEIGTEFANQIAAELGKGGTNVVVALPSSLKGMTSSMYMMTAGTGDECRSMVLVVGLRGKEWFHALWELACSEAKNKDMNSLMLKMARSLKVNRAWGSTDG